MQSGAAIRAVPPVTSPVPRTTEPRPHPTHHNPCNPTPHRQMNRSTSRQKPSIQHRHQHQHQPPGTPKPTQTASIDRPLRLEYCRRTHFPRSGRPVQDRTRTAAVNTDTAASTSKTRAPSAPASRPPLRSPVDGLPALCARHTSPRAREPRAHGGVEPSSGPSDHDRSKPHQMRRALHPIKTASGALQSRSSRRLGHYNNTSSNGYRLKHLKSEPHPTACTSSSRTSAPDRNWPLPDREQRQQQRQQCHDQHHLQHQHPNQPAAAKITARTRRCHREKRSPPNTTNAAAVQHTLDARARVESQSQGPATNRSRRHPGAASFGSPVPKAPFYFCI